ncbi:U4/U6.U5 tri-snRNP-associated protein 1-like [Cryptotermes secundus]|uniref:U4/U6.U5 tri-snRNP-associated protein 1-like n=1 Tax=Cryptotermes secundus TaxID=105785 RepID=UPI000CD7D915|nr:U4/U6.U5 tri-snRNP-associated protein 1-like [Cryptotermes secundus]XP_023704233.1 U4/U6.U5 tri-snRNP-associated protein 1-like [Cryptotermes secundus]
MLPQNSAMRWVTSPFMVWLATDEDAQELVDDEKCGHPKRYSGLTSDFKEKEDYKPNVKLDYTDDDGHVLNAKEAFRYLSREFHGEGPGKNKVEKRVKKTEQEGGNHLKNQTANSS